MYNAARRSATRQTSFHSARRKALLAEAPTPEPVIDEVLPREAASLARGVVRIVFVLIGVVLGLVATFLAMFLVGNGTLTWEVLGAAGIAFLVFVTVPAVILVPVFFLVSLRYINQLLPRSTTVIGDEVCVVWPRGAKSYPIADCKWAAGRSAWEWLGAYLRSHPTTLLIAPTGFVYMLGADEVSAKQHAAILSKLGVARVIYVPPSRRVFRRATGVVGGIGLGWVIGALIGAVVGFAIGSPDLYRTFAAVGMMAGAFIAFVRDQKGIESPPG
jgi:hypothetical protein